MNKEARAALDKIKSALDKNQPLPIGDENNIRVALLDLEEVIARYEEALKTILQYCPDESNCPDSHQIKSDKCVIYEHKVARDALNPPTPNRGD